MRKIVVSGILAGALLLLGAVAFTSMAGMRRPPAEEKRPMASLAVEAMALRPATHTVRILAWGTAEAPTKISIVPEVGGAVVERSARLEAGARVAAGELLVRVDPAPFRLAVEQAEGDLARLEASVERLALSEASERERLVLLQKTLALTRADHDRAKGLLEEGSVGSVSQVQALERAVLATEERILGAQAGLDAVPVQRRELEAQVASARARVASARWSLSRTEIASPLAGRVESAAAEVGQVIAPGREIARIVDESRLELRVPVDGLDLARWIPFEDPEGALWSFGKPAAGDVEVRWVEAPDRYRFKGSLVRVERYDAKTRQAVAVIVASPPPGAERLVEGMFCRVTIPGRSLEGVYSVPRAAVAQDGTVILARDGVLERFAATVLHEEEDRVILGPGLPEGALLVLSRLLAPVEGAPLDVTMVAEGGKE